MKNTKDNKVTNLKLHEGDLKKKYALKGAVAGVAISAIPIGIAVASNVFGMNIRIDDATFVGDFFNDVYSAIETWPGAIALGATITTMGAAIGKDKAEEKIKKIKKMK